MQADAMNREEAERWLAELIASPERKSAKVFQEGYEASLRKSGIPESQISSLTKKAGLVYDDLMEYEIDDVVEDETDDVDWEELEGLLTQTNFNPEDMHYKAADARVRQMSPPIHRKVLGLAIFCDKCEYPKRQEGDLNNSVEHCGLSDGIFRVMFLERVIICFFGVLGNEF